MITETIILTVLSGIGGWVVGRKRNNAEVKGIEINNKKGEIEAGDLVIATLERNVELLNRKMIETFEIVEKLQTENLQLKKEVYYLRTKIVQIENETHNHNNNSDTV